MVSKQYGVGKKTDKWVNGTEQGIQRDPHIDKNWFPTKTREKTIHRQIKYFKSTYLIKNILYK